MAQLVVTDTRAQARANVFLGATLAAESQTWPARIRNMSTNGALIEVACTLSIGVVVTLKRGCLHAVGEVAWSKDHRFCGLRFAGEIDLRAWVNPARHAGQERIDRILAALRSTNESALASAAQLPPQQIEEICSELEDACKRIAASPALSLDIAEELMRVEVAIARLRKRHDANE